MNPPVELHFVLLSGFTTVRNSKLTSFFIMLLYGAIEGQFGAPLAIGPLCHDGQIVFLYQAIGALYFLSAIVNILRWQNHSIHKKKSHFKLCPEVALIHLLVDFRIILS